MFKFQDTYFQVYDVHFNLGDTGNAAEHASAIVFSMKNKLNITLGVAVGSSCQISLMVLPLLVLIGWAVDKPMSMNLGISSFLSFHKTLHKIKYHIQVTKFCFAL